MSLNLNYEMDRYRLRQHRNFGDTETYVRLVALILLILMGCLFTGCSSPEPKKQVAWKLPFLKDKPQPAGAMTVIWENVYFPETQKRGLRGHVLFFSDMSLKKNIRVDGMLSVYVYNDSKKDVEGLEPDRIFRFKPDAVKLHEVKTDLGYTYVFWLPFDEITGEEQELTLLTRFDGVKGDRPKPAQSPVLLVGTPKAKPEKDAFFLNKSIQQVSHLAEEPEKNILEPRRNREITTINVSPGLSKQILSTPPSESPVQITVKDTEPVRRSILEEGFGGGNHPLVADWSTVPVGPQQGRPFTNVHDQLQQRMQNWNLMPQQMSPSPVQQVSHTAGGLTPQPQYPPQPVNQTPIPVPQPQPESNYQPQPRLNMTNNQPSFTQGKLQQNFTPVPLNDPGLSQAPNTQIFMGPPGSGGFTQ
ncbi:MAG: hypothetical protein LBQ54_12335 [Planctomycetaceae bacterium]|jgi:hypothetical protein|nr:hypothetical protein [Planctomycetaceae bacterium]